MYRDMIETGAGGSPAVAGAVEKLTFSGEAFPFPRQSFETFPMRELGAMASEAEVTQMFEFPPEKDDKLPWVDSARCAQVDPEPFFPEKGGSTKEAKKVCADCDVRPACLAYAVETDEQFGIWGGLSVRERRQLKRTASV